MGVVLYGLCSSPDNRHAHSQPADLQPPCPTRGPGWLEHDHIFCQHAALRQGTGTKSTQACTHQLCSHTTQALVIPANICHEPDHMADTCTILALQSAPPSRASLQTWLPRPQPPRSHWCYNFSVWPNTQASQTGDFGTHLCLLEQRKI